MKTIALQTPADYNLGLAIAPDDAHMVVSHDNHTLSVYALPGGEHTRTFGRSGTGPGEFRGPRKLCFTVTGNVLVVERVNMRVQEVTLTGDHVRFIGAGVIGDIVSAIAANATLIVVGKTESVSDNRIMVFDAVTGAVVRTFGRYDAGLGNGLMKYCNGIRFSPDNRHVVIAENNGGYLSRLSIYTLEGQRVTYFGESGGIVKNARDVEFADNGDVFVIDIEKHSIVVFSGDDHSLLRQWGSKGDLDGEFQYPTALAMRGGQLYVLDNASKRVQVFE